MSEKIPDEILAIQEILSKPDPDERSEYTFKTVESYGTVISSRHNKIHELATMLKIIDRTPEHLRQFIRVFWTDSKCGNILSIETDRGLYDDDMIAIGDFVAKLYIELGSDYVYLTVSNGFKEIEFSEAEER